MKIPHIIDRTRLAMGWQNPWQTRSLRSISHIARHHSATATGTTAIFENHWRVMGWRNGGYHYTILRNGDIERNYPETVVTNGVAGHNYRIINICLVGNSSFTDEQEQAWEWLVNDLLHRLPNVTGIGRVLGHNEFSNQATLCPGTDMNLVREKLLKTPPYLKYTVEAGDTLWQLSMRFGIEVADLQEVNNLGASDLIRVGQQLIIPKF
ncbi:MAG: LysM peptidoglycan-binding domain-containing protein [Turicibacter sp.]|nr:LysM peptidoglycan-binding domain-containing protein [Turicibacter sp.]